MIVLDTHIWIWWVPGHPDLTAELKDLIEENEAGELGISAISCWEIAKLVEYKRLVLSMPTRYWLNQALSYPGVRLLALSGDRGRFNRSAGRLPQGSSRPAHRSHGPGPRMPATDG